MHLPLGIALAASHTFFFNFLLTDNIHMEKYTNQNQQFDYQKPTILMSHHPSQEIDQYQHHRIPLYSFIGPFPSSPEVMPALIITFYVTFSPKVLLCSPFDSKSILFNSNAFTIWGCYLFIVYNLLTL